jgi:hypothetical protein
VDLVRRKDGGKEIRRMFEKDVLPKAWRTRRGRRQEGAYHIGDRSRSSPAASTAWQSSIFSLMRQMFRFAVDRDLIEADPTASIRKVKIGGPDG